MTKTVEEIRKEFREEMEQVIRGGDQFGMPPVYNRATEAVLARAMEKFDAVIADKERWLKMGEAADLFTQAMKLPAVEVKK